MRNVSLVSIAEYQWLGLVNDIRALVDDGIATPNELAAARCKWGATGDEAQLAYMEAVDL